jgi:hypothetical protein
VAVTKGDRTAGTVAVIAELTGKGLAGLAFAWATMDIGYLTWDVFLR